LPRDHPRVSDRTPGEMLKEYRADLHIHTCLSPCASLDLSPLKIVERARTERMDMIAITDHNTAKNVEVVMQLGEEGGLKVIPGMEVQTREEIHLLALFPDGASIALWDEEVYRHLPDVKNDPEVFGDQPIVDHEGNILRFEERLLINSLDLSLEEVKSRVEGRGGFIIPSHFDKGSYSLISQLGLIPPGLELEALEMSRSTPGRQSGTIADSSQSLPRIVSSDAHTLEDIGSAYTVFLMAQPTLEELRLALRGQGGRRISRKMDRGVAVL
jgi:predicted metal-dependent phosphoesterase TrpH